MNNQNRYYYLLGTIVAIGISAYLFVFPSFETAEFNAEVIENISKGVTTTVVSNENNEEINEETAQSEDIDIEIENPSTVNKFLVNSTAEKDIKNFTVYLLIGSDERSENSSESRGYIDGERADVIILGLVNETSSEKHLISIPRDVLISNPCTKEVTRINATYTKNSCGNKAENLAASIKVLTGININHFASFNFEGFEKIIDSFNGVEICVDQTQREGFSFELQKGCQTVSGATALNWVVSRNTEVLVGEKVVDKNGNDKSEWVKMKGVSDLSRNERQQYIILQLLNGVRDFRSLNELNQFINALEDAFIIDENLTINKAVNLLWGFRGEDLNSIKQHSLPVENYVLADGRQVLIMTENFSNFASSIGILDN
jgi:LCP family protein required for cell wall assembly